MCHLYILFDLFIHIPNSRNSEAFGQVYIESMLLKIPSIFSNSGIMNEISIIKKIHIYVIQTIK